MVSGYDYCDQYMDLFAVNKNACGNFFKIFLAAGEAV